MGLEETKSKYVWMNGKYVYWADANIHICSHVIHYGTGVFEASPDLITDYLGIIFQREARLLDLLAGGPKTLDEITAACIIYGRPKGLGAWDLSLSERMMMGKHVERLMGQGAVIAENGRYSLLG